jgi:hypothetical protein
VFTRLFPSKVEALIEIGEEMKRDGIDEVMYGRSEEVNVSEVIRRLLARADTRLSDDD